jgi:hypothetical protein
MQAQLRRLANKLMVLVPTLAVALSCAIFASSALAQAAAEAAGATSIAAGAASSIKPVPFPKFPDVGAGAAGSGGSSGSASGPHLIASAGPPAEDTNRKTLEAHAGKDASKLLLRATPVEAQIWVDGKIVGKTPLLLVLAPGKYQVEMRGARGQTGKSSVALLPRETRELAIKLDALYPARVTVAR